MQIINLLPVLHVNVFSISHWFHKTICIRLDIQKVILYFYTWEMFSYTLSFKYAIWQPLLLYFALSLTLLNVFHLKGLMTTTCGK